MVPLFASCVCGIELRKIGVIVDRNIDDVSIRKGHANVLSSDVSMTAMGLKI